MPLLGHDLWGTHTKSQHVVMIHIATAKPQNLIACVVYFDQILGAAAL